MAWMELCATRRGIKWNVCSKINAIIKPKIENDNFYGFFSRYFNVSPDGWMDGLSVTLQLLAANGIHFFHLYLVASNQCTLSAELNAMVIQ